MAEKKSDYYTDLGANLRYYRKLAGLSLLELSETLAEQHGVHLSGNYISMLERGERRISAEQLDVICKALNITPNQMYPDYKLSVPEELAQAYNSLPQEEKDTILYATNHWDGNVHALIQFMDLYMALPRNLRQEIASTGLIMYDRGVKLGTLDPVAPHVNDTYIDAQWRLLLDK